MLLATLAFIILTTLVLVHRHQAFVKSYVPVRINRQSSLQYRRRNRF